MRLEIKTVALGDMFEVTLNKKSLQCYGGRGKIKFAFINKHFCENPEQS